MFAIFFLIFEDTLIFAACAPGYSGQFYNESCPSGNFGDNCESSCYPECTDILCDHVAVCQNTNNTITTTGTMSSGTKISTINSNS